MRVLLIIAAVVLLMALVGWIKFYNSPQQSTISIEKERIQQDAERMVERGNEFIDGTRRAAGTGNEQAEPQPQPVATAPDGTNGTVGPER